MLQEKEKEWNLNCWMIKMSSDDFTLNYYKANFGKKYPASIPYIGSDDRIYGMWIIGANYKGSGYYGSYPPSYLERVIQLFDRIVRDPNKVILHLFSGSLHDLPESAAKQVTMDVKSEIILGNVKIIPDIIGDAQRLTDYIKGVDLIIADPPYSAEDAEHYGKPMVNRNKVVKECAGALVKGGYLVWLDQVLPMFSKEYFELAGLIGVARSTNHRFRNVVFFRRV